MSEKPILRVAVTGAAGQIAYSLLYQISSGYVFGYDQVLELYNNFFFPWIICKSIFIMYLVNLGSVQVYDFWAASPPPSYQFCI